MSCLLFIMRTDTCCHHPWDLVELQEVTSGAQIQGSQCAKCKKYFREVITKQNPVFVCRMSTKGCKYAICKLCHAFGKLHAPDYAI